MKKTIPLILLLLAAPRCDEGGRKPAAGSLARPDAPRFCQPWNMTFHLRETETGETLSTGAVFSDSAHVYVYDLARGAVVTLDAAFSVVSTVQLASIGRNTWAGDDFVVIDSLFVFLNGIDRRLELFDRFSGKHLRAIPIPDDLTAGAQKRSHRILSRLFYDNGVLMIGNEYRLAAFDIALGKRRTPEASVVAAENERLALYRKRGAVVMRDSLLIDRTAGTQARIPATHYPVAGKRFFSLGNRLYSLDAGKDSLRITEAQ